jgi:hypothetical protein
MRMRITIAIGIALCTSGAAWADRRTLIRAYEFETQPQGNLEFELWNDVAAPRSSIDDSTITHWLELEYGLTDKWDMALYHVFASGGPQPDPEPFHFDSWRLETRYRLAERGDWPVDVMIYGEIERPADFSEPFETEEKLILSKNLTPTFALVTNLVAEQHFLRADLGRNFEVDFGAVYEFVPALRVGAEFWTTWEIVRDVTTTNYFVGPAISVATNKFWFQVGAGVGLDSSQDQQLFIRSVLGFNL